MPSDKKPDYTEKGYGRLIWVCVLIIMSVVVKGVTNFVIFTRYWRCDVDSRYYYDSAPTAVCGVANAYFTWYIAIIVAFISLVIALWADSKRDYWYREVLKGKVVDFGWHSSAGTFSSGYQEHFVYVKGRTRQDEIRVYRHLVQPKTYYEYKEGQYIDFS